MKFSQKENSKILSNARLNKFQILVAIPNSWANYRPNEKAYNSRRTSIIGTFSSIKSVSEMSWLPIFWTTLTSQEYITSLNEWIFS